MERKLPDCYNHVRRYYGVPARAGMRVRWKGNTGHWAGKCGRLVRVPGIGDQYLHVMFDGAKVHVPVHPSDVEYLEAAKEE
jgi:hypothetical protein